VEPGKTVIDESPSDGRNPRGGGVTGSRSTRFLLVFTARSGLRAGIDDREEDGQFGLEAGRDWGLGSVITEAALERFVAHAPV